LALKKYPNVELKILGIIDLPNCMKWEFLETTSPPKEKKIDFGVEFFLTNDQQEDIISLAEKHQLRIQIHNQAKDDLVNLEVHVNSKEFYVQGIHIIPTVKARATSVHYIKLDTTGGARVSNLPSEIHITFKDPIMKSEMMFDWSIAITKYTKPLINWKPKNPEIQQPKILLVGIEETGDLLKKAFQKLLVKPTNFLLESTDLLDFMRKKKFVECLQGVYAVIFVFNSKHEGNFEDAQYVRLLGDCVQTTCQAFMDPILVVTGVESVEEPDIKSKFTTIGKVQKIFCLGERKNAHEDEKTLLELLEIALKTCDEAITKRTRKVEETVSSISVVSVDGDGIYFLSGQYPLDLTLDAFRNLIQGTCEELESKPYLFYQGHGIVVLTEEEGSKTLKQILESQKRGGRLKNILNIKFFFIEKSRTTPNLPIHDNSNTFNKKPAILERPQNLKFNGFF